jgi:hypothetical protein
MIRVNLCRINAEDFLCLSARFEKTQQFSGTTVHRVLHLVFGINDRVGIPGMVCTPFQRAARVTRVVGDPGGPLGPLKRKKTPSGRANQ